jgi:hypothetical protein
LALAQRRKKKMPYFDIWLLESNSPSNCAHIRDSLMIAGFPAEFAESFLAAKLPPVEVARALCRALSVMQ